MDTEGRAFTQEQTANNPHDKGYKRIFSIKKNFIDFIKKYVGLDWMMDLTEKDLELVDKEYVTDQFDTYESDLVYRVNTKEGSIYLFFLFELQSRNDFTMPFRLLVYMTAIWIDYFKNSDRNKRKQKKYRLPAVMPIVLYNGEKSWTAPCSFKKMVNHAELFGKYVVDFEYCTVSVSLIAEAKIKDSNTLVDNVLLADRKRTREDWIGEAASDLADRVNAMEQDDFNEWSAWFLNAKECLDEKERREFVRQLKEGDEKVMCSSFERLLNKEKAEGKAEGRAEGKAEGKAEDIIELLEDIGIPSETLIKYVMGQTDLDILRKWHKAAARAKTIEDFEQAAGFVQVRCE